MRTRSAARISGSAPANACSFKWRLFPSPISASCSTPPPPLPWERWLPRDAEFPVKGRSHHSQLSSVPACQKIVKRAIVERLRKAHRTEDLPETGPKCCHRNQHSRRRRHTHARYHRRRPPQTRLSPTRRRSPTPRNARLGFSATQLLAPRPRSRRPILRHRHHPDRSRTHGPQHRTRPRSRLRLRGLAEFRPQPVEASCARKHAHRSNRRSKNDSSATTSIPKP